MPKNKSESSQTEKILLLILSLISLGLLAAIVYVWYTALSGRAAVSKPGDFLKTEQTANPTRPEPPATPSTQNPIVALPLQIDSPQDEEIVTSKTVLVSGKSLMGAHLTIIGGKEDVVSEVSEDGSFSEKVTLTEGDNELQITVFDEDGNQANQKVLVIYAP